MMRGRTNHMGCRRGRGVVLVLRDGRRVSGRFHSLTDSLLYLEADAGQKVKLRKCDVRAFILKPRDHRRKG